jgi:hypothetical protein
MSYGLDKLEILPKFEIVLDKHFWDVLGTTRKIAETKSPPNSREK